MRWSIIGRQWRVVALPLAVAFIVVVNAASMAGAAGMLTELHLLGGYGVPK